MGQPQNQTPQSDNKRRLVFTKDAKLTVQRFAASAAPAADGSTPAKPGVIATISGYAILWNTLSDDRGGYYVRLLPNSAKFVVPTMALFHHDFSAIIGNTQNGTLRITSDDVGVKVEIDLPDTTTGRDVAELVDKRYVQGMSFSMLYPNDYEMVDEGANRIMQVSNFNCDEVTVTGIPAFSDTSIDVAKDNRMASEEEDDEEDEDDKPATASADAADDEDDDEDDGDMAAKKATPIRNVQNLQLQKLKLDSLKLTL